MRDTIFVGIVTGVTSTLLASAFTTIAIFSSDIVEKNISDTQRQKITEDIINEPEYRNVLIERMEESGSFRGEQGESGAAGNSGITTYDGHQQVVLKSENGNQLVYLGAGSHDGEYFGGFLRLSSMTGEEYVKLTDEGVWSKGNDYSDVFELATRDKVIPGTVMSVLPNSINVAPSKIAYDENVIGVISGAGSLEIGTSLGSRKDGSTDLPIAVAGQIYVRVCDEGGKVRPGDLLVSSSIPGVAMKASNDKKLIGNVVGKAMGSYMGNGGDREGLVRMLVLNR